MSKKEEFLKELEDLCSNYDIANVADVEFYLGQDGAESVIRVYVPPDSGEGYHDFILPDRPFGGKYV